jgi:hypothetical protein
MPFGKTYITINGTKVYKRKIYRKDNSGLYKYESNQDTRRRYYEEEERKKRSNKHYFLG